MPLTEAVLGADFGYAGMGLTLVYFLSPVGTCSKIVRLRDVQGFSAFPYEVGIFNCALWSYYATITMAATSENLLPNLLVNIAGVIMWGAYVAIFLVFSRERPMILRQLGLAMLMLAVLLLFFECVLPRLDWTFHYGGEDMPLKSSVVGAVTDVVNVLLYGSPLVVLRTVIRTKSVEFMPLPLSMLVFAVSCLWSTQALLIGNMAVLMPNLIGVALGIIQLLLYAVYCKEPSQSCDAMNETLTNAS